MGELKCHLRCELVPNPSKKKKNDLLPWNLVHASVMAPLSPSVLAMFVFVYPVNNEQLGCRMVFGTGGN